MAALLAGAALGHGDAWSRKERPARVDRASARDARKARTTAVARRKLVRARSTRKLRAAVVRHQARRLVGFRANPLKSLPKASGERLVVGVMGGAGSGSPKTVMAKAERLGVAIAVLGHVILTGAAPGLPEDSARGARSKGGLSIGISPHETIEAHLAADAPTDFTVLQTTKLPPAQAGSTEPNYMGREIDNIVRSDMIIIEGGRFGTLGEVALALELGKPVGVMTGSGGIADAVKRIVAASTRAGKPPRAPVIYDKSPERLVKRLAEETRTFIAAGGPAPLVGDGDVRPTKGRRRPSLARAGKAIRPAVTQKARVVVGYRANPIKSLPPTKAERFVIGVMGGAGSGSPKSIAVKAELIGEAIAEGGHVTLTGAAPGLPEDSARGARRKGGLSVGISPYETMDEHLAAGAPTDFTVLQTTKLPPAQTGFDEPNYMGREIDNIVRSDMIIIEGGRFGTLGEAALALELGKPVGVLTGSGGIADEMKTIVQASTRAGKPPRAPVVYDSNPQRLVKRLVAATRKMNAEGGPRPMAGDGDVKIASPTR